MTFAENFSIKMKATVLCLLLGAVIIERTEGKSFTRCELAKALKDEGFPKDDLPNCKFFYYSFSNCILEKLIST